MTPTTAPGTLTTMVDHPHVRGSTFRNWARTQSVKIAGLAAPSTEDEIVSTIATARRQGQRVKPVGAGHSWSDVAATDGILLSLDNFRDLVSFDSETGIVTVQAGMRLHELNDLLAQRGRALPVLGSISAQSIAGATATGTHGSAPRGANLSSGITSLRMVLANGDVEDVNDHSNNDLLRAARVGLGALGVVSQVSLRTVPAFRLTETVEVVSFDAAAEQIPDLIAREEFIKVWWLPHVDRAMIFKYARTEEPVTLSRVGRAFDEHIVNRCVFPALLSLIKVTDRIVPPINRVVSAAYFRPGTTVGRSDHMFNLPMAPVHDEMEYALPVGRAVDAFRFMREVIEGLGLHIDFIVELRFSARDDAWMSPGGGRDSCWIGAYAAHTRDRQQYFGAVEQQALEWDGRPHWGKQFRATSDQLRPRYPYWDEFAALRERLDPDAMFDNAFLNRLFGA